VLPQAIAFATRGELFLSPHLSKGFVAYTTTNKPIELSDRLKQVLLLTVRDFSIKEISQALGITDKASITLVTG